jgi:MoaA/NifB/PqqE/SkfB family radical SAM enzyme
MKAVNLRRKIRSSVRRLREARLFAKAMKSPGHPILAHIIPTRRCNLACTYCSEYDDFSGPVETAVLLRRVDKLAALGTTIITASGGEPLLHPELARIIRRIRNHGIIATVISNGYPLTRAKIRSLNRAGLDYLQISIDNLDPDSASKKSLKVLDRRLQWLAEEAEFQVTINAILGSAIRNPGDALVVARRARELGFTATVGIVHDQSGQLQPLEDEQRGIYEDILRLGSPIFSFAQYERFQKNLVRGLPNRWHCRAGCRYLYVCEDGLVHWCSQQRGTPGTRLEHYSQQDLDCESRTVKPCAELCTVSCVHQTAMLDSFRENPGETLTQMMDGRRELEPSFEPPWLVKLLAWMFLTSKNREVFGRIALRFLGVRPVGWT